MRVRKYNLDLSTIYLIRLKHIICLPEQSKPSPVKPSLHWQVYEASVLLHVALLWQASGVALDSSISKKTNLTTIVSNNSNNVFQLKEKMF